MAATVTWEELRDLATFRAARGCAISVYLDLDPSDSPTPVAVDSRINALLDEVEKWPGRGGLDHGQKEGLDADLERLRDYFESEFSRDGAHGFALFCAGLDGFWMPLPLSERVPDLVKVGKTFHLAPLVPLVGSGDGVIVAAVGRERGDLYRLTDGRVELLLVQEGADHPAWQCPKCGRLSAQAGDCPLDGTPMEESQNGADLAVHQTLAHGGKVRELQERHDLEPVEGIGALLRY